VTVGTGESPLAPGTVVGGEYELQRLLGRGGMGVVWAARHVRGGTSYALKFLHVAPGGPDDVEAVKRFLREARAAASVRHPHVVFTREVLELESGPVIVMELLAGESLRERLATRRLSLEQTARILLPVASAVGAAHQQGIVHRDLKPDNIFLSRDPGGAAVVKVLDFGIAKLTRADPRASRSGLTGSGAVLGTPHYMSPEQVFGERDIDQRADIWALGVILYECIAGAVPTRAANVGQIFKLIVEGGIKPLAEVAPDTPPDVAVLVDRMLSRAREERPFDLKEVARILRRYTSIEVPSFGPPQIQHDPAPERSSQDLAAVPPPELPPELAGPLANDDLTVRKAPAARRPPPEISPAASPRRSRLTTIGLGTLVISVLIGESVMLWRSHRNAAPAAARIDAGVAPQRPGP
jgi:serine/threonine protein kinase